MQEWMLDIKPRFKQMISSLRPLTTLNGPDMKKPLTLTSTQHTQNPMDKSPSRKPSTQFGQPTLRILFSLLQTVLPTAKLAHLNLRYGHGNSTVMRISHIELVKASEIRISVEDTYKRVLEEPGSNFSDELLEIRLSVGSEFHTRFADNFLCDI
jgi:hypothetical protein